MRNAWALSCVAASIVGLAPFTEDMAGRELMPVFGAVVRGPSVVLSYDNGANPYSGIGRYDAVTRCTAFFLDTAGSFANAEDPGLVGEIAPAYAVTEARCAAALGADEILIDGPGHGRVVFNYFADAESHHVEAPVTRVAFASTTGRRFALLELATSYADLIRQLVRPWPLVASPRLVVGDPVAVVGSAVGRIPEDDFLRLSFCRIDGIAPAVLENGWRWTYAPFHRCRDIGEGSVGSPVLSLVARAVVGVIATTTAGKGDREKCGAGHPCELAEGHPRSRPDVHYVSALAGIGQCFTVAGQFDVHQPGCSLDATPAADRTASARLESALLSD